MAVLGWLLRMPVPVIAVYFYVLLPVALLMRYLVSSVYGVLLMSIVLYVSAKQLFNIEPLTGAQLVLWLENLTSEVKAGVVGAVITVLGFFVAFHSATANWRDQTRTQLKLELAREMNDLFEEAATLATSIRIYMDWLIATVATVNQKGESDDSEFHVHRARELYPKQVAERDRLAELVHRAHGLKGRHSALLSGIAGAMTAMETAVDALEKICDAAWVYVPQGAPAMIEPSVRFATSIDTTKCKAFIEAYDSNMDTVSELVGGLRSTFTQEVLPFNAASLSLVFERRKEFLEYAREASARAKGRRGGDAR